jgi:heme-degrading monooxygenase HmoA
MFARLVSAQAMSDKLNEAIQIWKEKDIPLMESVKGYRGAYLLTDSETDKAISMTLWDSKEDSIADEQSTLHQEQVGMYDDILIGEIIHQGYEISAQDKI